MVTCNALAESEHPDPDRINAGHCGEPVGCHYGVPGQPGIIPSQSAEYLVVLFS